ncbi:sterol desaturase family protein [Alkalimarinus alittae]|uniref:Sterol desaturase family protein n=1 Tax=Alkalimarinus alittae TaxID=2961619 RepID=A0ABY6N2B5_9ALTE|nr:sterol desaturase family protein [Alkalimarinus alittae]UZE96224.1 sterol desaturase family protein [Alkalimarinus alittae]
MEFKVQYILLAFAPVFFGFILWEVWYLRNRQSEFPTAQYSWVDTISNGVLAVMHEATDAIAALGIMVLYHTLFDFRLFDIENSILSILLLFVLQDFLYYWFHRASHRVRWFWASHVVHHSSESLNFSTAFRQSATYPISGMWVFWLPLIALGFQPETVIAVVLFNLAYQFFIHTQVTPKLGWIEFIFNTPSHHRVHHARNPEYIDQNYAGTLIIWDRLFGTFVEEKDNLACEYGITDQIQTHNPITLTFHEWRAMLKDMRAPNQSLWHRLKHLWAPPEWAKSEEAAAGDKTQFQTKLHS